MILALDLSKSRTGWAFWPGGDEPARYGSWVLGSAYTSDGMVFAKLHREMADLHKLCHFEHVYFEEPITPAHLQGFTTIQILRLLAGLAAHVQSFAHAYRLRTVMEINVESWRPEFIGRDVSSDLKTKVRRARKAGDKRASARTDLKALTMERCRQLGFSPRFDDEADALGILTYSILLRGETPPWLAQETLRPMLAGAGA